MSVQQNGTALAHRLHAEAFDVHRETGRHSHAVSRERRHASRKWPAEQQLNHSAAV